MINSNKSCIEFLPDELWLQIFTYSPLRDLYYAWRNLNSHINAILHSARIGIYIENENDDVIHSQDIWRYFSSQIVHIKDERLNIITSLQSWPINLRFLPNFRSLYLARCSQQQFEGVLNFHQLTRLSLPCDYVSHTFLKRFVIGKYREEHFPDLRSIGRIWCSERRYSTSSSSSSINTNIQHVHLVMPTVDSSASFLQYLPELSLITVDYLAQENTLFSSCFIMAKLRRHQNDDLSNVLSKMNSSLQPPTTEENFLLLTIAACIHRLEINFNGHCDFKKLAIILDRCPILEQLRIRVKYYPQDIDLTSIRQLSRFFITLTFGDIQKETGKPMIIAKWPS